MFYEIELFLDAELNDFTSIFVEYPIHHKNFLNPGNAWVDFHRPGELAASEYTGLMIGNFSPRFGYLNYDDNQSWVYGGRTTTIPSLFRSKAIDEQVIRNRQIGISAPVKLGPVLVEPGVYNGSGPVEFSGGADNDRKVDVSGRIQYTLPSEFGLVGAGFWNAPATEGATNNTAGTRWGGSGAKHVRDINRYVAYFKFPNVTQVTLPDMSLGGKPFLVYGEYCWGTAEANEALTTYNTDQDFSGGYVELNFNILRDKLVGVIRYDYWDPNQDNDDDVLQDLVPTAKWYIANNLWLSVGYEYYFGDDGAKGIDDDRAVIELAAWF